MRIENSELRKILLVRNDNIGDLICSIPAIQLIRKHFPEAEIHLLVNSYNAPIVEPLVPTWVNQLVIYHKTKHLGFGMDQWLRLIRFYLNLRKQKYDIVLLLVGGTSRQAVSFARWSGAKQILGYGHQQGFVSFKEGLHEVEYSWNLARHLCKTDAPPPFSIDYPIQSTGSRLAIQITSRKLGNRWTVQQFIQLGKRLSELKSERIILLWSPGNMNTLTHPGDDEKAAQIIGLAPAVFDPRPTATLNDLIQTFKECRDLITPDGGAMHLAAAMGLRIVALFGQSDPIRWRPWTPRAKVLQSSSRTIQAISVDQVIQAWKELSSHGCFFIS